MKRNIIKIDEDKCNGCGLCVSACHEGAIELIHGKAKLMRDDYCDGLGNCLPVCPTNAITIEEREAAEFDEEAVKMHMENKQPKTLACGCPGTQSKAIERRPEIKTVAESTEATSQLRQWPVQIKLVPVNAPYFENANLLIAADCTAYAHANFHSFMKNKITIIGCPKLDEGDYSDKLTAIIKNNNIKSVTVIRMEVPCCGGIVNATTEALHNSGKMIPWQVVTIGTDGTVIEG
ncbi:MAG: 4Fe-4S ferredoxin [Clostridiales bacterium 43-6]|nr:MAG: 4Fe-4S ferredoxin [Clostridiales bacterium 43-6]